jgi:nucleoside recognition membrane protein YjiH
LLQNPLTIKRLSNAAIILTTKNPPVLWAGYLIAIVCVILVAGAPTPFAEQLLEDNGYFELLVSSQILGNG